MAPADRRSPSHVTYRVIRLLLKTTAITSAVHYFSRRCMLMLCSVSVSKDGLGKLSGTVYGRGAQGARTCVIRCATHASGGCVYGNGQQHARVQTYRTRCINTVRDLFTQVTIDRGGVEPDITSYASLYLDRKVDGVSATRAHTSPSWNMLSPSVYQTLNSKYIEQ